MQFGRRKMGRCSARTCRYVLYYDGMPMFSNVQSFHRPRSGLLGQGNQDAFLLALMYPLCYLCNAMMMKTLNY